MICCEGGLEFKKNIYPTVCIRKLQQQLNNSCVSAAVGVQIHNVKYGTDSGGWETDPAMLEWEPVHGQEVRR